MQRAVRGLGGWIPRLPDFNEVINGGEKGRMISNVFSGQYDHQQFSVQRRDDRISGCRHVHHPTPMVWLVSWWCRLWITLARYMHRSLGNTTSRIGLKMGYEPSIRGLLPILCTLGCILANRQLLNKPHQGHASQVVIHTSNLDVCPQKLPHDNQPISCSVQT